MKITCRRLLLATALFIMAALFVYPTVITFINSFLSPEEIQRSYGTALGDRSTTYMAQTVIPKLIPDMVSREQYTAFLFLSPDYLLKFWNSVLYALPITVFQLVLASMAAYGFSRGQSRIRNVLFFSYVVIMLMPYQVTLAPNYLVSKWLGIYDTPWAIILPGAFAPFGVYLLTRFMRRIPKEYVEAAELDGAGEWTIFRKIYLPQCTGALYAVGMLIFFDAWNMVEQPLVLLETESRLPLSIYLSNINASDSTVAFAAAVIYLVPCLLLFLHGEEHLEEGIITGGIK